MLNLHAMVDNLWCLSHYLVLNLISESRWFFTILSPETSLVPAAGLGSMYLFFAIAYEDLIGTKWNMSLNTIILTKSVGGR